MIPQELCLRVLREAVSTGGDYAEIFAQNTTGYAIHMVSDEVDSIKDTVIAGASVRVYKGLRSVMASTVDTSEAGLLRCARQAAEALGQGSAPMDIVLNPASHVTAHPVTVYPGAVPGKHKAAVLKEGYFAAREYSDAITQVTGTLLTTDHNILIASTEGLYTQDRQVRTRLAISAVAAKDGQTQTGTCAPGARMGLELFDTLDPKSVGIRAAEQAVTMASAGYCPAGVMPVAIENGFGGVIFHEACGHSLEAASVAYGRSQFAGMVGQKIANEKVTAIDDGTVPNAWGSIDIDDEGTPAQRNVLIEKGVLKGYLVDKFNGRRMGLRSTGSSRRQSYAYTPTSRMTNTFLAPGPDRREDIFASMEYGLYAKDFSGGSVNPVTGEFNFSVSEGYIVRNGRICEPVRGASLVGKGSEVIQNIDMVANDLELGAGMCGASSGSIATTVGQPLIRVSSITVGGR